MHGLGDVIVQYSVFYAAMRMSVGYNFRATSTYVC